MNGKIKVMVVDESAVVLNFEMYKTNLEGNKTGTVNKI